MDYHCKECKKDFKGDICPSCRRSVRYSPEAMFINLNNSSLDKILTVN